MLSRIPIRYRFLAPLLIAVLSLSPLALVQAALVLATSPVGEGATMVRVGTAIFGERKSEKDAA